MFHEYIIAKYIRISIEDAKSDSLSINNQRILIDKHIFELNIPNAKVVEFVDNGYSGTNFERPGIQELLEFIREGKVNCIVVKDFSRFGRNAIETGYYIERIFPLYRVRFISVADYFDSADYNGDTGGIEVAFKFLMHEHYSRDLSKKIKAATHEKMRRGEYVIKNCLFGYKLDNERKMIVDEPAAETIRFIYKLALEGNSVSRIAKQLYINQHPTPSKHKKWKKNNGFIWNPPYIYSVLMEEQYTGTYIAGKTKIVDVGSKISVKKPESEWYKIPNHHPAIIEHELFDMVREIMPKKPISLRSNRKLSARQYNKDNGNPIKGKVICGCCGHTMELNKKRNSNYRCRFTLVAADAKCHRLSLSANELSEMLFEIITKHAQVIMTHDISSIDDRMHLHLEQQSECKAAIERILEDKVKLYELYVLGKVSENDYTEEKNNLNDKLIRLNSMNISITEEAALMVTEKRSGETLMRAAERVLHEDKLTSPLVDLLIEKVFVYPGNHIEIVWKISGFDF